MIDLHTHTIHSDGDLEVSELLRLAQERELSYLAISDHDTMDAYHKLKDKEIRSIFKGRILPACEIAFMEQGRMMDLLAYGVDEEVLKQHHLLIHHSPLDIIQREQKRLDTMKEVCDTLHLHYGDIMITKASERANDIICDALLKEEENKEILERMEIKNRTTFYRLHYLNPNSCFYMKQEVDAPELSVVIDAVHKGGGICFLAHPFVYDYGDTMELIDELTKHYPLDGIECIHRRHSAANASAIKTFCDEHHLYVSGGSDFHRIRHDMGYGDNGTMMVKEELIDAWIHKLDALLI